MGERHGRPNLHPVRAVLVGALRVGRPCVWTINRRLRSHGQGLEVASVGGCVNGLSGANYSFVSHAGDLGFNYLAEAGTAAAQADGRFLTSVSERD